MLICRRLFFISDALDFLRFTVTPLQHSRWPGRSTLIFSECCKQATFERILFTPSSIEDFASSRRRIDNLSVWSMFQLFHSTLLESDRAARGRSLLIKKKNARPARWGPPEGWEPPGARSRKVGSLKKKRMETLKRLKTCYDVEVSSK